MNEDRIVNIEIKLTRQEDLVETLNRTVYQQQKRIDALEAMCTALARRVKDALDSDHEQTPVDEKPPHY